MKSALAVIGANWGDEGKGLAVDALAAELQATGQPVCVIRSNGGAQAGHGVELANGDRHVFHHVGAGSFTGAATHLSRFFVAHPMLLSHELNELEDLGCNNLSLTIDPRAPVTTPWDMAINQALETIRAGGRHGSTGLGFGETIERHEKGFLLTAKDLWGDDLRDRFEEIQRKWVPTRLEQLGVDPGMPGFSGIFDGSLPVMDRFLEDCAWFRSQVSLLDDAELGHKGTLLFEGAQGLQLDMDFGVFPHVTRSHTGLRNILSIAKEAQIDLIKPFYMTRAYATRHGAGPLPHETDGTIDWADVVDLTNAPNSWQGAIRQAPLDANLLAATIGRDLALAERTGISIDPGLGITCLDQLRGTGEVVINSKRVTSPSCEIPSLLGDITGLPARLLSNGPTRKTAVIFNIQAAIAA